MKAITALFGFDRVDAKLIWNFLKMHIRDKYLGSTLGSVWAIVNPLLFLGVFTFVFGYVYRIRLPGAETTLSYAIWLISGYIPWLASTEGIMAAAMSVVAAAGLVKNMAFKTEVLPISAGVTGFVPLSVGLIFLSLLLLLDGNHVSWHALFVFPVVVLQFGLVISLGFFLSAITVFVRDVGIALPNMLTIVLFATPIFYPIDMMPDIIQAVSQANPFYVISDSYRQSLVYHRIPNLLGLLYLGALALILGLLGLRAFRRVKGYFEARL